MPLNQLIFEKASRSQLEVLQEFTACLYREDKSEDSDTMMSPPDISLTLSELERKPDKGTLISMLKGTELIGYAIIIFFWSNEFGGDIIEIDELYVASAHRNSGVGGSFFEWLERTYSNSGRGFSLQASPRNVAAVRLYEKLGFISSRNKHMLKIAARTLTSNSDSIR